MEPKILNVAKIRRLQELRKKLPVRCSFAVITSQNLENKGITIPPKHIYQMVRGQRTVHENVLEEMQKLVKEFEEYSVEV